MEILADILHNRNLYARFYRTMAEVERHERESAATQNLPPPVVSMHMRTGSDRRQYNDPHFYEVAAIFTAPDGAADAPRDIIVYPYSNRLKQLNISLLTLTLCHTPSSQVGPNTDLDITPKTSSHSPFITISLHFIYKLINATKKLQK